MTYTINTLIHELDINKVLEALVDSYEDQAECVDGYKMCWNKLLSTDPLPTTFVELIVTQQEDLDGSGTYIDVSGLGDDGNSYSLSFVEWGELINLPIKVVDTELSPETCIANILWELTFYGFSTETIEKHKNQIMGASKEIDEALAKLPENPTEDDFRAVGLYSTDDVIDLISNRHKDD